MEAEKLWRIYSYFKHVAQMHNTAQAIADLMASIQSETATYEQALQIHYLLEGALNPDDPEARYWLELIGEIVDQLRQKPEQLDLF